MFRGKDLMGTLYEAWTECAGEWNKSRLYLSAKSKDSTKRRGVRRWMFYSELVQRFGEEGAAAIVAHKLENAELKEKEIKCHADAPSCEEHSCTDA